MTRKILENSWMSYSPLDGVLRGRRLPGVIWSITLQALMKFLSAAGRCLSRRCAAAMVEVRFRGLGFEIS